MAEGGHNNEAGERNALSLSDVVIGLNCETTGEGRACKRQGGREDIIHGLSSFLFDKRGAR